MSYDDEGGITASVPYSKLRRKGVLEVSDYSGFFELDIHVNDALTPSDPAFVARANVRFIETTIPIDEKHVVVLSIGLENINALDSHRTTARVTHPTETPSLAEPTLTTTGAARAQDAPMLTERVHLVTNVGKDTTSQEDSARSSATIRFGPDNVEYDEVFEYLDSGRTVGTTARTDFPDAADTLRLYATLRQAAESASATDAGRILIGVIDTTSLAEGTLRSQGSSRRTDEANVAAPEQAQLNAGVRDTASHQDPTLAVQGLSTRTDAPTTDERIALVARPTPDAPTEQESMLHQARVQHAGDAAAPSDQPLKLVTRPTPDQASAQEQEPKASGRFAPSAEPASASENARMTATLPAETPSETEPALVHTGAIKTTGDAQTPAETQKHIGKALISGDAPTTSATPKHVGLAKQTETPSGTDPNEWLKLLMWSQIGFYHDDDFLGDPNANAGIDPGDNFAHRGLSFGHPTALKLPTSDYLAGATVKKARVAYAIQINNTPEATAPYRLRYEIAHENHLTGSKSASATNPNPLYPIGFSWIQTVYGWTSPGGNISENTGSGRFTKGTIRFSVTTLQTNINRTTRQADPFLTPSAFNDIRLKYSRRCLISNSNPPVNATVFIRVKRQSDNATMFSQQVNLNNSGAWADFDHDLTALLATSTEYYVELQVTKGTGADTVDMDLDHIRVEIKPTSSTHSRALTEVITYTNADTAYKRNILRDLTDTQDLNAVPSSVSILRGRRPRGDPAVKHDGALASILSAGTTFPTDPFTWRAWIRVDGAPSETTLKNGLETFFYAVTGTDGGGTNERMPLAIGLNANDLLTFRINTGIANFDLLIEITGTEYVADGKWHFIEFVHEGAPGGYGNGGTGRVFVDGTQVWTGEVTDMQSASNVVERIGGYKIQTAGGTDHGRFNGAWCWMELSNVARRTSSTSYAPPLQLTKDANSLHLWDGEPKLEVSSPAGAFSSSGFVTHYYTLPEADIALGLMELIKRLHAEVFVDGTRALGRTCKTFGIGLEVTLVPS